MKDEVLGKLFTHILPVVFARIKIWAVGRELFDSHVRRDMQYAWAVAWRSVIDDKQKEVGVTFDQFTQEYVHAAAIHRGQNEITGITVKGANSTISIRVFTDDLLRHVWPAMFWCPAVARVVDAPEARFVLKEDLERLAYSGGFFLRCFEKLRPVFLKAA